jgi:hypothetical protein
MISGEQHYEHPKTGFLIVQSGLWSSIVILNGILVVGAALLAGLNPDRPKAACAVLLVLSTVSCGLLIASFKCQKAVYSLMRRDRLDDSADAKDKKQIWRALCLHCRIRVFENLAVLCTAGAMLLMLYICLG